jgi:nucleotide-binding universal stress UspA family protein
LLSIFLWHWMENVMNYKTLMVHMELDGNNSGLLEIAADLAGRFDARVIGVAACQPVQMIYEEGYTWGDELVADRSEIAREIEVAKAEFHQAMKGRVKKAEWRSCITFEALASYVADEARAADLIITRPDVGGSLLDNTRRVKIGDLALEAGRPLLIVPHGISCLTLNNAFVAWKDSREARRAVADALPLLRLAKNVTVLEAASGEEQSIAHGRVVDVAHWLESHDVTAEPVTASLQGAGAANLYDEMIERGCDFLVAGAYGHSRVGEFVFGGVTRDMLLSPAYCVLISH